MWRVCSLCSRPKRLEDVVQQEEVVKTLSSSVQSANLPHLLFYGPAGTGKTSTILAIANQLYGPELMKARVLELNASDERGINVVRTKIKNFAQVAVGKGQSHEGTPCPPYKIIILDEADSMTRDAQAALRRTMELYSKVTRFCLICNYVTKIIDPIASRCAKFRFKPLDLGSLQTRLHSITSNEGLACDQDALTEIIHVCNGDLRKAINVLQSARIESSRKSISREDIMEVAGVVPREEIVAMLDTCLDQRRAFHDIQMTAKEIIASGFAVQQILHIIQDYVIDSPKLSNLCKARICITIAEAERCLCEGADEYLQLLRVLAKVSKQARIEQ